MIISASRRTDIPAFYATWFINRIRAGFCAVPNPFNNNQVSRISLAPEDVDVIVFWSRFPQPLMVHLEELDKRGFHYYFQFTLVDYPRAIDRRTPPLDKALEVFKKLSEQIGPERVIWRYDPIVRTNLTALEYHRAKFERIAQSLQGLTSRCVISLMDWYRKARSRLAKLELEGFALQQDGQPDPSLFDLLRNMAEAARSFGIECQSCAEEIDLTTCGILSGKCIDDKLIASLIGKNITLDKDPGQRPACGCVVSRDIGMYDSCGFGCQYCYATSSFARARQNLALHDMNSPSLLGNFQPNVGQVTGDQKKPTQPPLL